MIEIRSVIRSGSGKFEDLNWEVESLWIQVLKVAASRTDHTPNFDDLAFLKLNNILEQRFEKRNHRNQECDPFGERQVWGPRDPSFPACSARFLQSDPNFWNQLISKLASDNCLRIQDFSENHRVSEKTSKS